MTGLRCDALDKMTHRKKTSLSFAYAAVALFILVVVLYLSSMLYHTGGRLVNPLDDTYIFFQYACQLADFQPMKYNAADPMTLGVSSPLYLLLLFLPAVLGVSGDGMVLVSFLLGAVFYAASAWLIYDLARELSSVFAARLAVVFFLLSGPAAWHYLSGMDTAFFSFAVLLAVWLYQRQEARRRTPGLAVLLVLLPLIRPEGIMLIAAYLSALAVNRRWKLFGRRLLQGLAGLALFALFNLFVSGELAPSSASPKSAALLGESGVFDLFYNASAFLASVIKGLLAGYFGAEAVGLMGGAIAWNAVILYLPPFFLLLALFGLSARTGKGNSGIGVFYALALLYHLLFLAVFLPLGWHHHRYIFPLLPPLLLFGAIGLASLRELWGERGRSFSKWLAAFCLVFFALSLFNFAALYGRNAYMYYKDHYRVSEYLRENIAPDVPLCAADVGILKYRTGNYLLDLKGIVSPWLGQASRRGAEALMGELAILPAAKRPRYAMLQARPDFPLEDWLAAGYLRPHKGLPATGHPAEMKIYELVY